MKFNLSGKLGKQVSKFWKPLEGLLQGKNKIKKVDIFYWNSLQTNNALGILKTYYFCGRFVLLDIIPLPHSRAQRSFGNSKSTDLLTTLKRNNYWIFLLLQDFPILFNHMNALQCNPASCFNSENFPPAMQQLSPVRVMARAANNKSCEVSSCTERHPHIHYHS